jgi:rhomboid protease GluP
MAFCIGRKRGLSLFTFGIQPNKAMQFSTIEPEDDQAPQRVMPKPWARPPQEPWVTQGLVGACVAVFIAMVLSGVSVTEPKSQQLIAFGAKYGPAIFAGQWWRLFTCMFVHVGIIHIAFNMWCLWDLGQLAERLYGRMTYLAIYLTTGVASSMVSLLWHPGDVSAGASGAIFGIAGALIPAFYFGDLNLPTAAIRGVLRSLLIFVGINLFIGFSVPFVDNSAHVGGLIAGLLLGAAIVRFARRNYVLRAAIILVMVGGIGYGVYASEAHYGFLPAARSGFELLQQNKVDDAIAKLEPAAKKWPRSTELHLLLAGAYAQKDQYAQAEAEYKHVLSMDPNSAEAQRGLGYIYYSTHRLPQAYDAFSAFIAREPRIAQGYLMRGLVEGDMGRYDESVADMQKAAQLDPSDAAIPYDLSLVYAKMKRPDDAIAALQQALKLDPNCADCQEQLAKMYVYKGKRNEAAQAEAKAEQLRKAQ